MWKRLIIAAIALLALSLVLFFILRPTHTPQFKTAPVERGSIVAQVAATGTLSAVVTVQVGTQVSGTIQKLYVDYNSHVRKGEPIAQIDPSLFLAQVEQCRGAQLSAEANRDKARVTLADSQRTLERNRKLLQEGIVSQGDFDTSQTAVDSAQAALAAAEASQLQSRGSCRQAETNLNYATIRSPVDGIVVSRAVDVGQTVAASFQTPTLFTIAQDLRRMQIDTSIDEADIGRVKVGQKVAFTVDAFPEETFHGTINQVRNAPIVTQNVVTYTVVITVNNAELKLKPGMTANVTIDVARADNVLTVPTRALRFQPTSDNGSSPATGQKEKPVKGERLYLLTADATLRAVPVQTGLSGDSKVEVTSDKLKEGDQVVLEELGDKKKAKKAMGSGTGPRF